MQFPAPPAYAWKQATRCLRQQRKQTTIGLSESTSRYSRFSPLSIIIHKKEQQGQHYCPIRLSKAHYHRLMDCDDDENYGQRKKDDIKEFHGVSRQFHCSST